MAKRDVPKEIIKLVSEYGKLIRRHGVSAERVILFGSYAQNLYRPSSDIDVCVVSEIPADEHTMQVELSKLAYGLDTRIQPHPVSLVDYMQNSNPFVSEIRRTGVVLFPS